ncbi:MAG: AAA family ATPase [Kofleriaceae bacterium]|nr:AAA family ATPase [Kofleriaceae bacterium]
MELGEVAVRGTESGTVKRMGLGFIGDDFGCSISLGLPPAEPGGGYSVFDLDPEIKHECIWAGGSHHPSSALVERKASVVKQRTGRKWEVTNMHVESFDSILGTPAVSAAAPGVSQLRDMIRGWRFYDQFRTDRDAPARQPQVGTRTPVLHHDGGDLAAALQTIHEVGDAEALASSVADAFPGATLAVLVSADGRFTVQLSQEGLLRPLSGPELSDGTLRYLLWIAALLTPRPPPMMVLNEPETSLHPELLPALARLIVQASQNTQVWVISHSECLISELKKNESCNSIQLEKHFGQTRVVGQGLLDQPAWRWA